jgi:hypothetical protein
MPGTKLRSRTSTNQALTGEAVDLQPSIVHATLELLEAAPTEWLLDFLWLLLSRASAVTNVDGFVSRTVSSVFKTLTMRYTRKLIGYTLGMTSSSRN